MSRLKRSILILLIALLLLWGSSSTFDAYNAPQDGPFFKTAGHDEDAAPATRKEWVRDAIFRTWFLVAAGLFVIALKWREENSSRS